MTCEHFLQILNDIDDTYLEEYSRIREQKKELSAENFHAGKRKIRLRRPLMLRLAASAAAVVLIAGALLLFIRDPFATDAPLEGTIRIFQSYEEFLSILPEDHLLRNLSPENGQSADFYGEFASPDGDSDSYDDFSELMVVITDEQDHATRVTFYKEIPPEAEAIFQNQTLSLALSMLHIGDRTVYYGYQADKEFYEAFFDEGSGLYRLQADTEEDLLAACEELLGNAQSDETGRE